MQGKSQEQEMMLMTSFVKWKYERKNVWRIVPLCNNSAQFDPAVFTLLITFLILTISGPGVHSLYQCLWYLEREGWYFLILLIKLSLKPGLENPYTLLFENFGRIDEDMRTQRNDPQKNLNKIKIPKRILPICSHCQKIRDDKGYWKRVETYLQQHSTAEFSHTICPNCAKKHYLDLDI